MSNMVTTYLKSSHPNDRHSMSGPLFTYTEPIQMRWIRPDFGPESGGTMIVIMADAIPNDSDLLCRFHHVGSNFKTVQAIYVNASAVTCISPTFWMGTFAISLVHGEYHVPLSVNDLEYTFVPSARVMSVYPSSGERGGGTKVAVTGHHFRYSPHVLCRFGTTASATITPGLYKSPEEIICTSPELDAGQVFLEVSLNGQDFTQDSIVFSYVKEVRISTIDPPFGGSAGGTVLTLQGVSFNTSAAEDRGDPACRFEGIADVKAKIISDERLQCSTPPHPTLSAEEVRVFVSTNGLDFSEEYSLFEYVPDEKVFAAYPIEVSSKGGTKVEVFGANFISSLRLTCRFRGFGTADMDGVEVLAVLRRDGSIECIAPKFVPSVVQLQVSNNGQGFSTDYVTLRFKETLSVVSIDPSSGSQFGGSMVTVHGKHFSEETSRCRFGSIYVPAIWLTAEEIRCSSPPHHPAMVTLSVTGNGQDFAESPVPFIFVLQNEVIGTEDGDAASPASTSAFVRLHDNEPGGWSLSELVPSFSGTAGGDTIIIRGTNFTDSRNIACAFGSVVARGEYISASEVRCETPRHAPSEVVLEVSMDGVTWSYSSLPFMFVLDHAVLAISPNHGPSEGSTIVTVYGSHFEDTTLLRCRFGSVAVPILEFVSSSQIRCLSPFNRHLAGSVPIEVSNNNMTYSDNFVLFRYNDYSAVTAVNPVSGPVVGGTVVNIKGVNFVHDGALACKFGDVLVPARFLTSTEVMCTTPLHTAGAYPIEVTLNGMDFTVSGINFMYFDGPQVIQIWPSNGPSLSGGTVVSVHGSGFAQTTDLHCRFNQMLSAATWLSDTHIICEAPSSSPGLTSFAVTNNREQWSPEKMHFLYVRDAAVAKLHPSKGFFAGQYPVFVAGSNFVNTTALACRFGGGNHAMDNAVRATYVSPTLLVCLAPAHTSAAANYDIASIDPSVKTTSTVTVEVTNNGLDFTRSGVDFTFISQCGTGEFRYGDSSMLCPNGTKCEASTLQQLNFTMCQPGTFQPRMGQKQCLACPVGFMCPDEGMSHPVICPAGFVCDETGLRIPRKTCPKGHYCLAGTKTGDMHDFAWDTNDDSDEVTCRNQTQYFHNVNRRPSDTEYEIVGDGVYRGDGVCAGVAESGWPGPRGGFGGMSSWSSDYETGVVVFQPAVRSWEWINRTAPETGVVKIEWAPDDDNVSHRCEHRRCEGRYLARQRARCSGAHSRCSVGRVHRGLGARSFDSPCPLQLPRARGRQSYFAQRRRALGPLRPAGRSTRPVRRDLR